MSGRPPDECMKFAGIGASGAVRSGLDICRRAEVWEGAGWPVIWYNDRMFGLWLTLPSQPTKANAVARRDAVTL